MQDYAELAGFSSYYLEDSWVLDIEAHPGTLIVRLESVLLPEHPAYAPPPTDAYCYRIGTIRFEGIEHLSWT